MTFKQMHRGFRQTGAVKTGLVFLTALSVACDPGKLLEVDAPTQILEESLNDPTLADLLVNSMQGTFYCALGSYTVLGTEITDLLTFTGASVPRGWVDARNLRGGIGFVGQYGPGPCDTNTELGSYSALQLTRAYADDLLAKLNGWTDEEVAVAGNRTEFIATTAAYSGLSTNLIGEGFCTAAFDLGPEIRVADVFTRAEGKFTEAIAAAQTVGNTDLLNLAHLGRARVRLNLGRAADAATDAALVPAGFLYNSQQSAASTFQYNIVYYQAAFLQNTSVREPFGMMRRHDQTTATNVTGTVPFSGWTFGGMADPRMGVVGGGTPREVWLSTKYASLADPLPIARYEEAVLIIAEAEHAAGNLATAVTRINELHTAAGLPDFVSTDAVAILDHIIEERKRELFLESHALGDWLRYNLPFLPAAGSPYEGSGLEFYGTTTCMPLPENERVNNPNVADAPTDDQLQR